MFQKKWLVRIMIYLMLAAMVGSVLFYAIEALVYL
jgi:hypothetical protein